MKIQDIVKSWFDRWTKGKYNDLPVHADFIHISPYGQIKGKKEYTALVEANLDKFLGHRFNIIDALYEEDKACIRYTAIKDNFFLDVTEWHYVKDGLIQKIIAYYNIEGEISDDRKLKINTK